MNREFLRKNVYQWTNYKTEETEGKYYKGCQINDVKRITTETNERPLFQPCCTFGSYQKCVCFVTAVLPRQWE
jgi:hypothetical protein